MRNIKAIMAYRGTKYHGFQRQENAVTVQEIVENALLEMIGEKVVIYGCSRTDTGVHANRFCFSFKTDCKIPAGGLHRGLNTHLPRDISILSCEDAPEDFNARFSCKGKEYIYKMHCSDSPDPFQTDLALHYRRQLNVPLMQRCAAEFVGTHDFTSFCSRKSDKENMVRTIHSFTVEQNGTEVVFRVSGDGFLYNMVRIMIGTLIWINEEKLPENAVPQLLAAKDRVLAGKTARAHGLYLNEVYY